MTCPLIVKRTGFSSSSLSLMWAETTANVRATTSDTFKSLANETYANIGSGIKVKLFLFLFFDKVITIELFALSSIFFQR